MAYPGLPHEKNHPLLPLIFNTTILWFQLYVQIHYYPRWFLGEINPKTDPESPRRFTLEVSTQQNQQCNHHVVPLKIAKSLL